MTNPNIPVTEDELHAYIDDELPVERRADVEAWLAAHPDDAERVRSWRAMAEALHARYDAIAYEPVPKRLEIERLAQQPRKWIYGAIAATLVAFVAGGGVGWLRRRHCRISRWTRWTRTASMWWRCAIRWRCREANASICSNG
jgi:anti-sigma factor RsiW